MGGQDKRNAGAEIAILYFFLKATAHVSPSFFFSHSGNGRDRGISGRVTSLPRTDYGGSTTARYGLLIMNFSNASRNGACFFVINAREAESSPSSIAYLKTNLFRSPSL